MSLPRFLAVLTATLAPVTAWAAGPSWQAPVRLALVLIVLGGLLLYPVFLFIRFGRRGLPLLAAFLATLLLVLLAAEFGGLAYLHFRPRYRVLYVQPDRTLGWLGVPRFSYPSTGEYGEFLVNVVTNSLGFRDREHAVAKPPGVVRVALLGDSLVEAIQVPMPQTAASRLEDLLNRDAGGAGSPLRFEVFNFGVSNYSLGQYFLVWQEHVRRFEPDYVVALVAGFQMVRTAESAPVSRILGGVSAPRLRIRPTFLVEGGRLSLHPAPDYDLFRRSQQERIEREFGGSRIHRITPFDLARDFTVGIIREFAGTRPGNERSDIPGNELPIVNLMLLQKLAEQVAEAGGRLVIADTGPFFGEAYEVISRDLRNFCARNGTGYVDLSPPLLDAMERSREDLTWPRDGHFTARGNEVIAEAVGRYLSARERRARP